jgi:hypothetical protein
MRTILFALTLLYTPIALQAHVIGKNAGFSGPVIACSDKGDLEMLMGDLLLIEAEKVAADPSGITGLSSTPPAITTSAIGYHPSCHLFDGNIYVIVRKQDGLQTYLVEIIDYDFDETPNPNIAKLLDKNLRKGDRYWINHFVKFQRH